VGSFASNNNMTMEEFQQTLAEDGTSYRQFREDIRAELIISRLQRAMINRRIAISEQDVQALLNSPFYQQMFSDEYRVGHIMRSLEDDATEADREAAVVEAAGFAEELRNGADFAQMAIAKSSARTAYAVFGCRIRYAGRRRCRADCHRLHDSHHKVIGAARCRD
jgi:peptidyl-prolyl cis-trans isomerase SurA